MTWDYCHRAIDINDSEGNHQGSGPLATAQAGTLVAMTQPTRSASLHDDTTTDRLTQSAIAGTLIAVPDYVRSTPGRIFAWTAILGAYAAAVAKFDTVYEDTDHDVTAKVEEKPDTTNPKVTWGLFAGGIALNALGLHLHVIVQTKLARALERRGVKKPHTLLGAALAAVMFAALEAAARVRQG